MNFTVKRKVFFIVALVCLALSLAVMGIRIFAIYNMVDPATGFFIQPAHWIHTVIQIYSALILLFFLFALIFGFRFSSKEEKKNPGFPRIEQSTKQTAGTRLIFSHNSTPRIFISVFCGLAMVTFSVFSFIDLQLTPWEKVLHGLSIAAGLYFMLQYTPLLPLYSKRRTMASLLPVIWSGFHMVSHFLTSSRVASGEYHDWQMVMLCMIAVFLYLQALFTTPAKHTYHYNLFYAAGIFGAGLIFIFALPTIFLSSFWYYTAFRLYTNHYALMTLIAGALYMLVFVFASLNDLKQFKETDLFSDTQDNDADEPLKTDEASSTNAAQE